MCHDSKEEVKLLLGKALFLELKQFIVLVEHICQKRNSSLELLIVLSVQSVDIFWGF